MGQVAENGKVVIIHYTLTDADGDTIDSSDGGEPLPYLHGADNIVEGLEEALAGKEVGAKLQVTVPPEKGYGLRPEGEPQPVSKESFPPGIELEEGMQFMIETDEGHAPVWVVGVTDDAVLLDGRHPLAGQTLHFDVEVVGIREPTDDETAHGHPHGVDGTAGHHH